MMLLGVFETASKPSMHRQPSQNADDIGARLGEPSSFVELTRTTGVPRYRMAGSTLKWVIDIAVPIAE
jgi:hypothetical protein